LGPVIVTPDELPDPYSLTLTCRIERGKKILFEGSTSTSRMNRKIEDIVGYLRQSNSIPGGTVLCTGTGIIVEESAALAPGDCVTIECPGIGTLSNHTVIV
jgi:2-dehydro-3-deoxy-D-arabinonate dehydratase